MNHLHELKKQYVLGVITETEYKKKEDRYIRFLLNLCYDGHITKEELYKRVTG